MALVPGASKPDSLVPRVLSAAVLAPLAVVAAWTGGAPLAALTILAAALMGWEWARLTNGGNLGVSGTLIMVTEATGAGLAALGWPVAALGVVGAGAGACAIRWTGLSGANFWAGLGTFWVGAACIALLWLAADPVAGRATVLWLFALVWATDSAAYVVGRWAGGPRLAPRWSPKKTWSGALGGVAAAGLVGAIASKMLGISMLSPVSCITMVLSVAAQVGDLAESAAKRRFGVKDTSGLIPGHGGLLDRLDGMLAASLVAAALSLARGASPVVWS